MKVILIDGNSFCYRAFYAIRELRSSKGEPTNAVYGFITMLDKLVSEVEPDGLAVAFDVKGPTFRHKRFEDYKVHRKPMPDDLAAQMPVIKDVLRAMNVPIFELPGYEADDVMATLARVLEKKGHETFIVTGDKDALQLVTKKVKVLNPQKENKIYDEKAVVERFGVEPARVVEVMALSGDASDNIPGVDGVGEKTAMKLIAEHGSLEAVLKNVDTIKGDKLRENLARHADQARMSRELALIDTKVPLEVDLPSLARREPDKKALAALYERLEFRSLLKALGEETRHADSGDLDYYLIQDEKAFSQLVATLGREKEWAFDLETTGIDVRAARPVGVSFSFKERQAYYVNFEALGADKCLAKLKKVLEDGSVKKIGQNLKFETNMLRGAGIALAGADFDTMIASYVLNPSRSNHNKDDIAFAELGLTLTPIEELIGKGKAQITMDRVDIDKVYRYGCQDADVTLRLKHAFESKLKKEGLVPLFADIEMPLVKVLADMEYTGVAVDTKLLAEYSKELERTLETLTRQIHKLAGEEFNIQSPKQLGDILFAKLKLPVVKKTKTGASTDVEVLTELSEIHPLPKEILKYRELSKLKSTYVDALPELVHPKTGRVHTSFNQTVTATGRLSSTDPNLQNIPVRREEGRKIRRAFVAGSRDSVLVSADYSQIELRVLAHLSEDEALVEAFRRDADIHRYTASLVFNVKEKEVTDQMRESAKTVNFGILYGMGAFSLAKSLGISNDAAKDFIKAYFDRYPSVKTYLDGTLAFARKHGYVETAFKRRRYIPEIQSRDPRMRAFAERTAINAPIQGTASDIIKIAMVRIDRSLEKAGLRSKMILQVHDELLFEGPKSEEKKLVRVAVEDMQEAVRFKVPMRVSVKSGPNWLDMEDLN